MKSDDDLFNQNLYVALVLQTDLSLQQLSKWTSASNDAGVDRDCTRKLRNPKMQSSRGRTKADLLLLQSMVLLKHAGFDLDSVLFDDNKLISHIKHRDMGTFSYNVIDHSPIDCSSSPAELFKLADSAKAEYVKKATLVVK